MDGPIEEAADLRDLALVLARAVTDTGRRTSLDDVLEAFGQTRESLDALPGDEEPMTEITVTDAAQGLTSGTDAPDVPHTRR